MKREVKLLIEHSASSKEVVELLESGWEFQADVMGYYFFTRDLPEEPEAQEPVLATEVIQLQNSIAHGAAEEPETCPKCAAWESLYDQCRSLPAPGNALSKDVLVLESDGFSILWRNCYTDVMQATEVKGRSRLTIEKLPEEPVGPQFAEILPAKKRPDLVIDDSAERTGRVR